MDASRFRLEASRVQRLTRIPLWLFIAFSLVFDFVTFWVLESWPRLLGGPAPATVGLVFFGVAIGQVFFAACVGGLWSRSWMVGYLFSCLLACLGLSSFALALNLRPYQFMDYSEMFWANALVPVAVLAASFPLLICRNWRGWRLERGVEPHLRTPSRLEDLFTNSAVLAATLVLTRIPMIAWEVPGAIEYWPTIGFAVCGLGLASSIFLVPAVGISFRTASPKTRLLLQLLFLVVAGCIAAGVAMLFRFPLLPGVAGYESMVIFTLTVGCVLFCGIWSLILSGMDLSYYRKGTLDGDEKPAGLADRADVSREGPAEPEFGRAIESAHQARIMNRWLTIVFFIGVMLVSAPVMRLQHWRDTVDQRVADLSKELAPTGGLVRSLEREVVELDAGREANDGTIDRYLQLDSLATLSLANSGVTDEVLDKLAKFAALESLDLSGTKITSAAVPKLLKLKRLRELKIAGTALTAEDIEQLVDGLHLYSLDLSDLDLTAQQLREILRDFSGSLAIRSYGFNDATLGSVLRLVDGNALRRPVPRIAWRVSDEVAYDLRGNAISGACLDGFVQTLRRLELDGNPLTDTAFNNLVAQGKLGRVGILSLSDTLLTDAFLKALSLSIGNTRVVSLRLGDGKITEAGLPVLGNNGLYRLALNSRQFTGECFQHWYPDLLELDMSGTSIDDEAVVHLGNIPNLRLLHLADTGLTDGSLSYLARLSSVNYIDLSGTQVTADGLAGGDLRGVSFIGLEAEQYSGAELSRVKSALPYTELWIGGKRRAFGVD